RYLALGQTVDLIVEEDDLDVDVAPEGVQQVSGADGQAVAVAGDDPDGEVRTSHLQAGGEGGSATVDGVEAVGVHVVREAAGAANARHEDHLFALHAQRGQRLLHLGQDRVIAAAGAPTHFLVAGQVLRRQGRQGGGVQGSHGVCSGLVSLEVVQESNGPGE